MFGFRPSLKHFAVLKVLKRRATFSIWLVRDRRNPELDFQLVIPTKLVAWPIIYKRLEILKPRLVRLRNLRPAILIAGCSTDQILSQCRAQSRQGALDPMYGFALRGKSHRRLVPILFLPILVYALSFSIPIKSKSSQLVEKPALCSVTPFPRLLTKSALLSGSFEKEEIHFRFTAKPKNGGLYYIRARRVCDSKLFEGNGWKTKEGMWVDEIN